MKNTLSASWKLTRVALHMAHGLLTITFVFPKLEPVQKTQRIQAWAQVLLERLAINLVVNGKTPRQGPMLLAANHISWLDVYVILATCPCRFVAKSEVRQWPLVGRLAAATGTLFISRQSPRDAVRVVHQMTEHLQTGDTLAIFPEGTTSNGLQLLPFHANLFQAAISANVPVQPVAMHFSDEATGQASLAPIYIDQDTLLGSIWRTLKAPPLRATLSFGATQLPLGRDRRALATDMRAAVDGLRRVGHC
jgi:1-acyl-sn-glycerol-3-phosphate acyltransferase